MLLAHTLKLVLIRSYIHSVLGAIFDQKSRHLVNTFNREVSRLDRPGQSIEFEQTSKIVDCQDNFLVSNASKQRLYSQRLFLIYEKAVIFKIISFKSWYFMIVPIKFCPFFEGI